MIDLKCPACLSAFRPTAYCGGRGRRAGRFVLGAFVGAMLAVRDRSPGYPAGWSRAREEFGQDGGRKRVTAAAVRSPWSPVRGAVPRRRPGSG